MYSGDNVLLKGVDTSLGNCLSTPLHQVYISSSHVNGPVTVGITSSLPVDGIDFLLGNDLAGGKVIANSLATDMPCICQQFDPVPNLDPACVVTRESKEQENIADTLVWESSEEESNQEYVSEGPESPRLSQKATKQKSLGAGNDHEVESKKLSRRKSTGKGIYTESMGKRKKKRCKHLEDNQRQHEEKHQKEEEERRKQSAAAKLAKKKKEREDEDEEEVKSKIEPEAKKKPELTKTTNLNNNPCGKKTRKKKRNSQRHSRLCQSQEDIK